MKKITIIGCIAVLIASCSERQYFDKSVKPVDIQIERFDNALLNMGSDSASVREGVRLLWAEYPEMMSVFTEELIGIYAEDTNALCAMLPDFLNDTLYGFKKTNRREQEMFADVSDIEKSLGLAFGRLQTLYPEMEAPTLYFFVSGFYARLMWIGDALAVGTDMYLGSDYEYYNRVVYEYQKPTMRKECIAGDVMSAYLFRNIAYTSQQNRLLENMIYQGKIVYLMQQLMQEEKPWEVMGYTKEKWQWCEKHEAAIWRLMMDKQDLYKSDHTVITSYMNDGPFTSEISQDAPSRLGTWVGWRIVESYMEHNEEVSMQELMAEGDAQKVLQLSAYRP